MQPKSDDALRMMLFHQHPHQPGNSCFKSNIGVVHTLLLPSVRVRKPVGSFEPFFVYYGKGGACDSCSQTELLGWRCRRERSLSTAALAGETNSFL